MRKRLAQYHATENGGPVSSGDGRMKTLDIQTDHWLEEIRDRPPEAEAAVQTEVKFLRMFSYESTPHACKAGVRILIAWPWLKGRSEINSC